jgi:hypothetical protein
VRRTVPSPVRAPVETTVAAVATIVAIRARRMRRMPGP